VLLPAGRRVSEIRQVGGLCSQINLKFPDCHKYVDFGQRKVLWWVLNVDLPFYLLTSPICRLR
jgi:hypothetical protein